MPIVRPFSPNLDQKIVYEFLGDPARTDMDLPITARAGFEKFGQEKVLDSIKGTAANPLRLFFALHEWYTVTADGQTIGSFDLVVPWEQTIEIECRAILFFDQSIQEPTAVKAITNAFLKYNPQTDGDPDDFIALQIIAAPLVKPSMFWIDCAYSIKKIGAAKAHDDQKKALLAPYQDRAKGTVSLGPNLGEERMDEGGYFAKRNIKAHRIHTELEGGVPPLQPNSINRVDNPKSKPEDVIPDIIKKQISEGCILDPKPLEWKIAALSIYPEFMVQWRPIAQNCHLISLPVLFIRISAIELWGYTQKPSDTTDDIVPALEDCFWKAALSGAVVGIALGNFPVALETFQGIFTELLKQRLIRYFKCLAPGLALFTKVQDDWHEVL